MKFRTLNKHATTKIMIAFLSMSFIRCSEMDFRNPDKKTDSRPPLKQVLITREELYISGTMILSKQETKDLKAARIYFEKDAILKTNGEDTTIEADEIISNNGRIQTFSEIDEASIGQNGKPSGILKLHTNHIEGNLTLEIRGQKGGQGFKGQTGEQGEKGTPSSHAPVSIDPNISTGYDPLARLVCRKDFYSPAHTECANLSYEDCRLKMHPGVGGSGYPGYPGHPGLQGATGGSLEDATIEIPDEEKSKIQIIYEPGSGGNGGIGGDGGLGGTGGEGAPMKTTGCDPSPSGKPGPTGPQGAAGFPGEPGKQIDHLILNGEITQ